MIAVAKDPPCSAAVPMRPAFFDAVVSGSFDNTASGRMMPPILKLLFLVARVSLPVAPAFSVFAGVSNEANNTGAVAAGGFNNTTSGNFSSVFGGDKILASIPFDTVVGKRAPVPSYFFRWPLNNAYDSDAAVADGRKNTASGYSSSVFGGDEINASIRLGTVVGDIPSAPVAGDTDP
jgi:hypothetical protein